MVVAVVAVVVAVLVRWLLLLFCWLLMLMYTTTSKIPCFAAGAQQKGISFCTSSATVSHDSSFCGFSD